MAMGKGDIHDENCPLPPIASAILYQTWRMIVCRQANGEMTWPDRAPVC
jgi:hypothetical protein